MSAMTRTNIPAAPARATTIRRFPFRGERPGPRHPADNVGSSAARVRLRLLAAFLPVTAVLYVGAEALDPRGTDQVVTSTAVALKLLPIAAAHSSQLYLSGSLSVLALGGLAASYAAIAALVTGRGWVIATIAALLGGLGAFAGSMLNVLGGISPLGTRRALPTVLDASAAGFPTIHVSAGRRGLEIELAAADLVALVRGSMASIARRG